jgi:hypothetical protein
MSDVSMGSVSQVEGKAVGADRDGTKSVRSVGGSGRVVGALLGAVAVVAGFAVPESVAQPATAVPVADQPLSITYVARSCPAYSDIMANKARNNLQESLRDLGPDTNYVATAEVTRQAEANGTPVPPCVPLSGWTFSTGTGITGPTSATLNLSTVTNPMRQDITTTASTAELNPQGLPTGRTIEGAVTVQLNAAEQQAVLGHRLWVQGGTPGAPLNGMQDQYGFGALRCALDAVNGDNVETVNYPKGARHVFCYYYTVSPPPGAGTIRVVKHIDGAGQGDFRFDGNVSYGDTNADGINDFVLSASTDTDDSQTFVRGESDLDENPWVFTEALPDGSLWDSVRADCVAVTATGGPGSSEVVASSSGEVRVGLVAGETVTCTYNNRRSGGIGVVEKESLGGTGTFDVDVLPPPGEEPVTTEPVTTTEPGVPVTVLGPVPTPTGVYTAVEQKPAPDGRGTWELTSAVCNGEDVPILDDGESWRVVHEVVVAENPRCLLTDSFTPGGAISVEKVTLGGTGAFGYTVVPHPVDDPAKPDGEKAGRGIATTTTENTPIAAVGDDGQPGPLATELLVDESLRYTVTEHLPPATAAGSWEILGIDCGGAEVGAGPRPGIVELTPENPTPTCRFTNVFVPAGTLDVVKTTSADTDLRPDPARVVLTCADRTSDQVVLAPAATSGSIPRRGFNQATTCVVTEPETGGAPDARVTTTATLTVDDGTPRSIVLGKPFPVRPGQTALVRVDNRLTTPQTPPPAIPTFPTIPTPPNGGPVPPGDDPSQLAQSGEDMPWLFPAAVMATVMLVAGGVLVYTARNRRRLPHAAAVRRRAARPADAGATLGRS